MEEIEIVTRHIFLKPWDLIVFKGFALKYQHDFFHRQVKKVYINIEQGLEEYAVNYRQDFILKECNWEAEQTSFNLLLYILFQVVLYWWFYFGDVFAV